MLHAANVTRRKYHIVGPRLKIFITTSNEYIGGDALKPHVIGCVRTPKYDMIMMVLELLAAHTTYMFPGRLQLVGFRAATGVQGEAPRFRALRYVLARGSDTSELLTVALAKPPAAFGQDFMMYKNRSVSEAM
jgi:hypothetical protein